MRHIAEVMIRVPGKSERMTTVEWDGGKLRGDPVAVALLELEEDLQRISPTAGPYTANLRSAAGFGRLCTLAFDEVISFTPPLQLPSGIKV